MKYTSALLLLGSFALTSGTSVTGTLTTTNTPHVYAIPGVNCTVTPAAGSTYASYCRIAACYNSNFTQGTCGQAAADAFCNSKREGNATSYGISYTGYEYAVYPSAMSVGENNITVATASIDDKLCDPSNPAIGYNGCVGFTAITCRMTTTSTVTYGARRLLKNLPTAATTSEEKDAAMVPPAPQKRKLRRQLAEEEEDDEE